MLFKNLKVYEKTVKWELGTHYVGTMSVNQVRRKSDATYHILLLKINTSFYRIP